MSDDKPAVSDPEIVPPPLSVSKRGTIIVRIKRAHQRAGIGWLRGAIVAGVAAGVFAVARYVVGC